MSAETKWTPGRWRVGDLPPRWWREVVGGLHPPVVAVAAVAVVDDDGEVVEFLGGGDEDTALANARLIAAAPRLYAALEQAAEEAEALVMNDATMADYFSDKAAEWRRLLAAARGEAAP